MRFLLDANMPRSATSTLLQLGHQVEFARDIGLAAASDEKVAAHAQATQAVLLTRDLDFADIRRYPPNEYDGIVVLRLPDSATADEIVTVLALFMKQTELLVHLAGRLAIVEQERVRFRPAIG